MVGGSIPEGGTSAQTADLSTRLIEQFFRRWFLYSIPVVLLVVVGVRAANNVSAEFSSRGTLSASANPLVETPEVRGGTIGQFETPASGISRLINEQLRSDAFARVVAERGLMPAVEQGLITLDTIRGHVRAGPRGENLLTVSSSWGDGKTAFLLVDSTISSYLDLVAETVAIDSNEAIDYWTERQTAAQARVDTAQSELTDYVATLPELDAGEQRTTDEQLNLNRLDLTLTRALEDVDSAQDAIDSAQLNLEQSQSQAGRQVRVVDTPVEPLSPQSTRLDKLTTMVVFTIMGVLIALAALVVTTLVDHSVRSPAQLRIAAGVDSVAVVGRAKVDSSPGQSGAGVVRNPMTARPDSPGDQIGESAPGTTQAEIEEQIGNPPHSSTPGERSVAASHDLIPHALGSPIRQVLNRFELTTGTELPKVIAVTAAVRGEGVTTISRALASVLARDFDARVCWIDLSFEATRSSRRGPAPEATDSDEADGDPAAETSSPRRIHGNPKSS